MGWKEYYQQEHVQSFSGEIPSYVYAFNTVLCDNGVIWPKRPVTCIRAGFFPTVDVTQSFLRFCSIIHPHPKNRILFTDMNQTPFSSLSPNSLGFQARLETLPLQRDSIDLMVLDYTADFMDNQSAMSFAGEASRLLTPMGLVMVSYDTPLLTGIFRTFREWRQSKTNKVRCFSRSNAEFEKLFSPLKNVGSFLVDHKNHLSCKDHSLDVFARHDSVYLLNERGQYDISYSIFMQVFLHLIDRESKQQTQTVN